MRQAPVGKPQMQRKLKSLLPQPFSAISQATSYKQGRNLICYSQKVQLVLDNLRQKLNFIGVEMTLQ